MDADGEDVFIMYGSNRVTVVNFINVKTFTEDIRFIMRKIFSETAIHLQLLDLLFIDQRNTVGFFV
jgi:hypothetical protein